MTTRVLAEVLASQLGTAHEFARDLIDGMTDDEYFWEPVPGCWSVRRNEGTAPPELPGVIWSKEARPNTRPWYAEHGWTGTGWEEAKLTTIAWLLTHLASCQVTYYQDAFDDGWRTFDDLVPTTALEARALFEEGSALLAGAIGSLDDDALLAPDRSPRPPERRLSFVNGTPLWHLFDGMARHVVHHAAEIGRMRDLYRLLSASR